MKTKTYKIIMNINLHVLYNCCEYVFVCRDVSDGYINVSDGDINVSDGDINVSDGDINVKNKFLAFSNL